jgi:hypothetical protein
VSRPPGHGGAGAPAATCAHPAAGLRTSVPGPRVITGTAAQPRQARLAAAVVLAGAAGLAPGAGSRLGTAAGRRELYRSRPGVCSAPVLYAAVLPSAAGSRVAGLAAGAVG